MCQNLSFFQWNHFWATFTDISRFFSGHTARQIPPCSNNNNKSRDDVMFVCSTFATASFSCLTLVWKLSLHNNYYQLTYLSANATKSYKKERLKCSATRFGEISPLLQNLKQLLETLMVFQYLPKYCNYFGNYFSPLAKSHRCKWPNFEKNNLVTLLEWLSFCIAFFFTECKRKPPTTQAQN